MVTLKYGLEVIENGTIRKLGTISYSPSIVTMTVSLAILEIFIVKEWPDLDIWVWGQCADARNKHKIVAVTHSSFFRGDRSDEDSSQLFSLFS